MALSLYHFREKRNIGHRSRFFHTLPAFDTSVSEEDRQNIAIAFSTKKTRMVWLPENEKKVWGYDYSFWRNIQTCETTGYDGQTERQTDTARRHRPRLCTASSGKNQIRIVQQELINSKLDSRMLCVVNVLDLLHFSDTAYKGTQCFIPGTMSL